MKSIVDSSVKFPAGVPIPSGGPHNITYDAGSTAAIGAGAGLTGIALLCVAYCMLPAEKRAAISSAFHNCAEKVSEGKEYLKDGITSLASSCCSLFTRTSATEDEKKSLVPPEVKSN